MSPIGGGKPLFDLISSGRRGGDGASGGGDGHSGPGAGSGAGSGGGSGSGDRPEGSPSRQPQRATAGRSGGRSGGPRVELAGQTLTVPMVWVYAGIGLILLIVFAGYGIGYQLGTSATREAERRAADRDAERVFVDDPLRPGGSSETGSGGADSRQGASGGSVSGGSVSGGANTGGPTRAGRAGGVLDGDGRGILDPRRAGVNYLELVSLPREKAIEAVRYLSENGEEAIAVPLDELDPGRRRSNTSDAFRVIAIGLAVPGDQYSASADARRRFEQRLARLGKAWTAEGGASDFSDPLWRRFGG